MIRIRDRDCTGNERLFFNSLHAEKVAADVNTDTIGWVKILEKLMTPMREFFYEERRCMDSRYSVEKNNWLQ